MEKDVKQSAVSYAGNPQPIPEANSLPPSHLAELPPDDLAKIAALFDKLGRPESKQEIDVVAQVARTSKPQGGRGIG